MQSAPTILVFDSGLGGLTVFREIVKLRADANFIYAADDEAFPYGRLSESELSVRVVAVMSKLIGKHRPDLIVIACNTASTLVLAELRRRFDVPFVGTVPAIKPACAGSQSRLVSVLGTEATVSREYTKTLIRDFAQGCEVTLVGSRRLAVLAEDFLHGVAIEDSDIVDELMPCFVERNGLRTDTIVLACTHYPLLQAQLSRLSPWPVTFVDPAPAIARRVVELAGGMADAGLQGSARFALVSGRPPSAALSDAIAPLGLRSDSPV